MSIKFNDSESFFKVNIPKKKLIKILQLNTIKFYDKDINLISTKRLLIIYTTIITMVIILSLEFIKQEPLKWH